MNFTVLGLFYVRLMGTVKLTGTPSLPVPVTFAIQHFCAVFAPRICVSEKPSSIAFRIRSFMIQFTCEQELTRTLRKGMNLPNERQFIKE